MRDVGPTTSLDGITTLLLQLPEPNPPQRSVVVSSWASKGARFCILYEPSGQLRFKAVEPDALVTFEVTSCRLIVATACTCIITAIWSLPGKLELRISDTVVGSTMEGAPPIPEVYNVETEGDVKTIQDLSTENFSMIKRRRDQMIRQKRSRHSQDAGINYMFVALKCETLQINDLLNLIYEGKLYHVIGLAARLRLLVAEKAKTNIPLLQWCAAVTNKPLIVFTNKHMEKPLDATSDRSIMFNISAHPDRMHRTPIDLDLWLDSAAGRVGGRSFSHKDLIAAIGNTVGAHVDQNLHPYVVMLRGFASELHDGSRVHDFLIQYILTVVRGVMPLAEGLVDPHHPSA